MARNTMIDKYVSQSQLSNSNIFSKIYIIREKGEEKKS